MKHLVFSLAALLFSSLAANARDAVGIDDCNPSRINCGDTATFINKATDVAKQTFEFGISSDKRPDFSIILTPADPAASTLTLTVRKVDSNFGDFDHEEALLLNLYADDRLCEEIRLSKDVSFSPAPNFYRIEALPEGVYFSAADEAPLMIASAPFTGFFAKADVTSRSGNIALTRKVVSYVPAKKMTMTSFATLDEIAEALESCRGDNMAGIWEYIDEATDPDAASIGGKYTIAIIPEPPGGSRYLIVYIDGAATSKKQWLTGMLKGTLWPTPFQSNFNLSWVDSEGDELSDGCDARIEGNLLTLDFPLLKSQIRFGRKP